jgi:UDP-N-acetylglucosamine kinase
MDSDVEIENAAYDFIKDNSAMLINNFCGKCTPVATPISLFMAGSPGAGKTEISIGFMKRFETVPLRIDADEIRKMCPKYIGSNAHLFQKAATKGVHMLYDYALHNKLHVILDGTFAYGEALQNIERSLKRDRLVQIWYVFQEPKKAWEFTQAREASESRHVSKETFIKAFLESKKNVIFAKKLFPHDITLNLLVKNVDNSDQRLYLNISGDQLDPFIGSVYTEDTLHQSLI